MSFKKDGGNFFFPPLLAVHSSSPFTRANHLREKRKLLFDRILGRKDSFFCHVRWQQKFSAASSLFSTSSSNESVWRSLLFFLTGRKKGLCDIQNYSIDLESGLGVGGHSTRPWLAGTVQKIPQVFAQNLERKILWPDRMRWLQQLIRAAYATL